jgi:hypothetical protein
MVAHNPCGERCATRFRFLELRLLRVPTRDFMRQRLLIDETVQKRHWRLCEDSDISLVRDHVVLSNVRRVEANGVAVPG